MTVGEAGMTVGEAGMTVGEAGMTVGGAGMTGKIGRAAREVVLLYQVAAGVDSGFRRNDGGIGNFTGPAGGN